MNDKEYSKSHQEAIFIKPSLDDFSFGCCVVYDVKDQEECDRFELSPATCDSVVRDYECSLCVKNGHEYWLLFLEMLWILL